MPRVTKVQAPKLFEAVAAQLREDIVGGELHPGDKLRETELAEQFGVSRGPIREALRELAREGLVVDLPRRGTLVSAATLGDLLELYDIRQALETFAVELAIRRATPEDLARVAELYDVCERAWRSRSGTVDQRNAADLAFHLQIFAMAGNARMVAQCEQLFSQTAMLVRSTMRMNPTLQLSPPDGVHKDICDAVVSRDVQWAKDAVVAHYQHTRERLFTFAEGEIAAAVDERRAEPAAPRTAAASRRSKASTSASATPKRKR